MGIHSPKLEEHYETSQVALRIVNHHTPKESPKIDALDAVIDYHDLTIVYRGSLSYEVNGQPYTVGSQELIYIPEGARRRRPEQVSDCDYLSLNFYCRPGSDAVPHAPVVMRMTEAMTMTAAHLRKCADESEYAFRERCTALLTLMLSYLNEQVRMSSGDAVVEEIKKYISRHWQENPGTEEAAEAVNYNAAYCCQLFRKYENRSIGDYLSEIRLAHAKDMLLYGEMPVKTVAARCGISRFYFCRWFREQTGLTPTEFRNRME